jgi:hypothetical protein
MSCIRSIFLTAPWHYYSLDAEKLVIVVEYWDGNDAPMAALTSLISGCDTF